MYEFDKLSADKRAKNLLLFMQDVKIRPLENVTDCELEPEASSSENTVTE